MAPAHGHREVAVAKEWKDNWGFLAKHGGSEPRGFTTNMVKYSTGGGAWNVKPIRIPDDSTEGYEAARSEQVARERMSSLEWTTAPANPTKQVDDRYGRPLVHDQYRGVESRDAAKRLVTHSRQALGEASQTEGIDPNQKYSYPMTSAAGDRLARAVDEQQEQPARDVRRLPVRAQPGLQEGAPRPPALRDERHGLRARASCVRFCPLACYRAPNTLI